MKQKNIKIAAIILVCIVMCLPLVFTNRDASAISVIENRGLAKMPSLESTGGLNADYIKGVEEYVDDNIGFKQNAILVKTGLMYSWFGKFSVPDYVMGKDQNLFYSEGMNQIKNYQGKMQLSEAETELLMSDLEVWNEIVENNGGKFFFMPIPDKEEVYPELYPDSVLRYSDKSTFDCLTEKMQSKEWFVDVKKGLLSGKKERMLYYRNYDPAHWNMYGAWIGYKELMNHIISSYGDIEMLSEDDLIFSSEEGPGTWLNLASIKSMGDIMRFEDEIISVSPIGGFKSEQMDINTDLLADGQIYFHYTNKYVNGNKILVVGDSYAYGYFVPLLAESFSDVYFTNFIDVETVDRLYKEIQPDIMVIEVVNRGFYYWPMVANMEKLAELNSVILEK